LTDRTNCWIVRALEVLMRQWLLAVVVAAAGCAAQGLPIEGGGVGKPGPSGGGGTGGTPVPDMARPLGGPGDPCQSACDCMGGLACPNGACGKSMFGPIYCCDSSDCPANNFCQSANGGFGTCSTSGGPNPGGPPFFGDLASMPDDAGVGSFCRQFMCSSDSDCTAVGCTMCGRRGTCR
jgi:hypothetical protein